LLLCGGVFYRGGGDERKGAGKKIREHLANTRMTPQEQNQLLKSFKCWAKGVGVDV